MIVPRMDLHNSKHGRNRLLIPGHLGAVLVLIVLFPFPLQLVLGIIIEEVLVNNSREIGFTKKEAIKIERKEFCLV